MSQVRRKTGRREEFGETTWGFPLESGSVSRAILRKFYDKIFPVLAPSVHLCLVSAPRCSPLFPMALSSCRFPILRSRRPFLLIGWIAISLTTAAWARELHVDAAQGNDDNHGLAAGHAWQSLQHAVNQVRAGDTVWVHPGVYPGALRLFAKGTPEAPIIFRATEIAENRVVITNAHRDIRDGTRVWRLEDAERKLYSVPFEWDMPARVLYDGVDLYPFSNVDHLKALTTKDNGPGPRHGYAFDAAAHRLYVRLHIDGRYGSRDPNEHLMAVAPPTGLQREGTLVGAPHHYGFGVLESGDAHVIFDGFTFETPGVAGVYTEANHVTVRRSWFRGCRTGVAGNYQDRLTTDPTGTDYFSMRLDRTNQQRAAANVTIEYCDYSQYPAHHDAVEVMRSPLRHEAERDPMVMWARKDNRGLPDQRYTYEIGIAARIGRDWTVRRSYVHDAFEGLSCHSVWASVGLRVEENIFERMIDNAVETEDHAADMTVQRNVIIDALEPFSFQPIRGEPWPGPVKFVQNIIINSPELIDVWLPPRPHPRGAFKLGIKTNTWERNPHLRGQERPREFHLAPPGFIIAHNTVLFPGGRLITTQGDIRAPIHGIKFFNNVLVTDYLTSRNPERPGFYSGHFEFAGNAVAPARPGEPGPGEIPAENGGHMFPDVAALGLDKAILRPQPDSPLRGAAQPIADLTLNLPDLGALQPGDTWYPLQVGPLAPSEDSK